MLHKHCGLDKWKIWEYTLPQVTELLKKAQKYIRFEIEASMAPIKAAFGMGGGEDEAEEEEGYTDVISEEDFKFLSSMGL